MRIVIFILLFFVSNLYSVEKWNRDSYKETDYKNFRKNVLLKERIDFENIDYPRLNAAIFFVTNEIRVKQGLKPLEYAIELERSAWNHSKTMVIKHFFSHENPEDSSRKSPDQRAKLSGVSNPHIAENIATSFGIEYIANKSVYPIDTGKGIFSYSSGGKAISPHTYLGFAESVVKQWMDSPGHRANILSTKALQMGCGAFFYNDKSFYNMPMFTATQNFQWFEKIKPQSNIDSEP